MNLRTWLIGVLLVLALGACAEKAPTQVAVKSIPSATVIPSAIPTARSRPTETPRLTAAPTATSQPIVAPTSTATAPRPTAIPTATLPPTAAPTATPQTIATLASTERPTSTATPRLIATVTVSFNSGALGLSRTQWERNHQRGKADGIYTEYDSGQYSVAFLDNMISHIERNYGKGQSPLTAARKDTAILIPADSRLIKTYSPPNMTELIVDVYHSELLNARFPGHPWTGGEPGDFIAVYGVFDGKVPRTGIALGNKP